MAESVPVLLSNNFKKLAPMLFKISHWNAGKVRNYPYKKKRNGRKIGQCFERINSFTKI
jgi:hypothetical protein